MGPLQDLSSFFADHMATQAAQMADGQNMAV
jgi:hypothetical protein